MTEEAKETDVVTQQKEVAFYSHMVRLWGESCLIPDKFYLVASAAYIAALMAFSKQVYTYTQLALFSISSLLFLAAIYVSLVIFSKNKELIEDLIRNGEEGNHGLGKLDKLERIFFLSGQGCFCLLAISFAASNF